MAASADFSAGSAHHTFGGHGHSHTSMQPPQVLTAQFSTNVPHTATNLHHHTGGGVNPMQSTTQNQKFGSSGKP